MTGAGFCVMVVAMDNETRNIILVSLAVVVVFFIFAVGLFLWVGSDDDGEAAVPNTPDTSEWVPEVTEAPTTGDFSDEAFDALMEEVPSLRGASKSDIDAIGVTVCDGIDELGIDIAMTIALSTALESGVTGGEAGAVVAYGVLVHCPEHVNELAEWAESEPANFGMSL